MRILLYLTMLAVFTTEAAAAELNFVDQFLKRYRAPMVDPAAMVTPPPADQAWQAMVESGALPLTIADLIRLMLHSNLDVTVNRFSPLANQYFIQSLFRPFEPTLDVSARVSRSTSPTQTQLEGAESLSRLAHTYSVGYGQTLQSGTRLDVDLLVQRSSSNNRFSTFNPSYSGTLTYQIYQPLMRNFGRDIQTRTIRVARNNLDISEVDFEIQTIEMVNTAQNLYWDLVGQREDIKVRRQSLELAQKTLSDNKRQVEIGTLAPIEVVQAESAVAQRQELMVTTSYQADQLQDRIKRMMTNLGDPALVLAQLSPVEPLKRPSPADVMTVEEAIKYALESRPEMKRLDLETQNSNIELQYTKNQLLPSVDIFGGYQQSGVGGVETRRSGVVGGEITDVRRGGLRDAFSQLFGYDFTGYFVGFNVSIPLSNKSARAEYSRILTQKQLIESRRNARAQAIALEVRNANSMVDMNRARIDAAQKALQLATLQLEAEQKKFQLGTGQIRFVLQEQQNLTVAKTNELQALVNYAKALVDYDRAVGRTLRKHSIEIDKQLVAQAPAGLPGLSGSETSRPTTGQTSLGNTSRK